MSAEPELVDLGAATEALERPPSDRMATAARLAVMVAHDLRSPLASIVLNLDVLGDHWAELPASEIRACLRESWQAAQQVRVIVEGMLELVRLGPQAVGNVSLHEVLLRVVGLMRPLLRSCGHVVEVQLDDDALVVRGNLVAVEQIFLNLLLNAAEASRAPITIRVTSRRVPGSDLAPMLEVRVADNGPESRLGDPPAPVPVGVHHQAERAGDGPRHRARRGAPGRRLAGSRGQRGRRVLRRAVARPARSG